MYYCSCRYTDDSTEQSHLQRVVPQFKYLYLCVYMSNDNYDLLSYINGILAL